MHCDEGVISNLVFSGEVLMTTGMAKLINVCKELGIILGFNN